jgi:hypothetical protein
MIFGLQMHYAGWTLLPLLPLLVAAGRRRIWLPALAAGLLLASLTLAPFALGLQQNSASDVYSGSHIASILKQIPPSLTHLSGQGMVALSWLSSGSGLDRYLGGNQQVKLATQVPAPLAIQLGFGLLTGIGLLKVWQYATKPASMLICLWALLPVAIFTPSWTAAPPHYFTAILPALAVLGGVSVSWLMRTRWTILLAFGLCASVILTMGWWLALLNFLDVTPTSESGTPLHRMMDVRTELLHYDDVVLTLDGTLGLTDYDIWTPMLWRSASCLRRPVMNDGGIAVLPGHPFAALRAPDAHAPVDDGLYLQGHPYSFPLRPGEGAYTIFTFDQAPPWNGPALTDLQPITFDSRLQLTGYALKYNRVYLRWQVGQPPMHNYRFFIDFLDNAGGLKAQHEAILYEYHSICQGDVLITWNDLARPVEAVTLRVGIYGADNEHGAGPQNIVPDSTGNRIGTWADIPLPAGGS